MYGALLCRAEAADVRAWQARMWRIFVDGLEAATGERPGVCGVDGDYSRYDHPQTVICLQGVIHKTISAPSDGTLRLEDLRMCAKALEVGTIRAPITGVSALLAPNYGMMLVNVQNEETDLFPTAHTTLVGIKLAHLTTARGFSEDLVACGRLLETMEAERRNLTLSEMERIKNALYANFPPLKALEDEVVGGTIEFDSIVLNDYVSPFRADGPPKGSLEMLVATGFARRDLGTTYEPSTVLGQRRRR